MPFCSFSLKSSLDRGELRPAKSKNLIEWVAEILLVTSCLETRISCRLIGHLVYTCMQTLRTIKGVGLVLKINVTY